MPRIDAFVQLLEPRLVFAALPASVLTAPTIIVGDLNGDGKGDLVTAQRTRDSIRQDILRVTVQLGNGDGTYRKASGNTRGSVDLTPEEFEAMCIGDVNSDGTPDLVMARVDQFGHASGYAIIDVGKDGLLAKKGDVKFTVDTQGPVVTLRDIATGDLDGDGPIDLVLVGDALDAKTGQPTGKPTVRTIWGIGGNADFAKITYTDFTPDGTTGIDTVFTGDVDGDGLPDIVATEGSASLATKLAPRPNLVTITGFAKKRAGIMGDVHNNPLYRNVSGGLGALVGYVLSNLDTVGLADLNGDGRADLIGRQDDTLIYSSFDQAKLIWSPKSNIFLYGSARVNSPPIFSNIAVGDVDGDGIADFEVSDALSGVLTYGRTSREPAAGAFGVTYKTRWRAAEVAIKL